MATNAREEILSRIRSALSPASDPAGIDGPLLWEEIPRSYRCNSAATKLELIELLTERLHDYDAHVLQCAHDEVTSAIGRRLSARGVRKLVVPGGFSEALLPEGFTYLADQGLTFSEIESCDGVITEATLAIAETGTIVLQSGAGQGRRAVSLLPDYHLCLLDVSRVHATVPEGMQALAATSTLPTTFISGPSATADIEMTRIKGVHGPRFLDVILVSDVSAQPKTGDA